MRRTKQVAVDGLGYATVKFAECDNCGRGLPLDGTRKIIEVRQTGPLTVSDWTDLDFCSVECLGRHFA